MRAPRAWSGGRLDADNAMSNDSTTPFDSIESSHEYVALLADIIEESRRDVEAEIALANDENAGRRKEALQLVSYNLAKLSMHITSSRRILNDLRTLRRLLLGEREAMVVAGQDPGSLSVGACAPAGLRTNRWSP
jgi:hypothetical protein